MNTAQHTVVPLRSIDLASPEQVEARTKRIAAADHRLNMREADMHAARDIRKHHELLTLAEVFEDLNGLMASMRCAGGSDMQAWHDRLAELACDMEDDLQRVYA